MAVEQSDAVPAEPKRGDIIGEPGGAVNGVTRTRTGAGPAGR